MQAGPPKTALIITRKRSEFGQEFTFVDKDAHQDYHEWLRFPDSAEVRMVLQDWSCSVCLIKTQGVQFLSHTAPDAQIDRFKYSDGMVCFPILD